MGVEEYKTQVTIIITMQLLQLVGDSRYKV